MMEQQPQQQPAAQPEKSKKKFNKKWWFWMAMCVILGILLIVYFFVISDYRYQQSSEVTQMIADDAVLDEYISLAFERRASCSDMPPPGITGDVVDWDVVIYAPTQTERVQYCEIVSSLDKEKCALLPNNLDYDCKFDIDQLRPQNSITDCRLLDYSRYQTCMDNVKADTDPRLYDIFNRCVVDSDGTNQKYRISDEQLACFTQHAQFFNDPRLCDYAPIGDATNAEQNITRTQTEWCRWFLTHADEYSEFMSFHKSFIDQP